jgi:hypothetical protein
MGYYTGIGSRETPDNVIGIMEDAAYRLAQIGWILRSGKAAGADAAFQRGMQKLRVGNTHTGKAEIYVPWKNFKGGEGVMDRWDITLDMVDQRHPENKEMRWEWVKEVHPAWDKLSQGARKLHERNIHQLFGFDLADAYLMQSKFVLYFALEDKKGNPKGGTATAVNLAKKQGIRTLNLLHEANWEVLEKFITAMEDARGIKN